MADFEYANQSIVIDNGSGFIKAGFAGDDKPKCVCPAFVGTPKHTRIMTGALEGEYFYGNNAETHRGLLYLRYPMEHGIVTNWDDMEKIWSNVFTKEQLNVSAEDHPVLLTEAPLNPMKNREKAAEIFFESFGVKALYVSIQAVLALYASGRITGVVLDSGDGVTQAVPIVEGFALKHSIMRSDVAGRDVTRQLQLLLRKEGYLFRTSAEFDIVRTIKEQACYVAVSPLKEDSIDMERNNGSYVLPDGQIIKIGTARYTAPEVLFAPKNIGEECEGVHEVLMTSIQKTDMDLRRILYSNILLSGGSTMFKGFGERLLSEVKKLAPKDVKIKISAPPERKNSTWSGGSILASLEAFKKMWVTKQEFESEGVRALRKFRL